MTQVNGNDSKIVKNGEKATDDVSQIKLLSKEEYKALSASEQANYVRYSPSLQSQAYNKALTSYNALAHQYNKIAPMISMLSPYTEGGLDITKQADFAKMLETMQQVLESTKDIRGTLEKIQGMAKEKVIGQLIGPLVSILTSIFRLIGSISGMIYAMVMNPFQMVDAYYTAFKDLDLSSIKNSFNNETTPNLENAQLELEELVWPDEEIKAAVNDNIQNIKDKTEKLREIYNQISLIETFVEGRKALQDGLKEVQEGFATSGLSFIGLNTDDMINAMKVDFEKVAQTEKGNPHTQNAQALQKNIQSYVDMIPEKYISNKDLATLKNIENAKKKENA